MRVNSFYKVELLFTATRVAVILRNKIILVGRHIGSDNIFLPCEAKNRLYGFIL